MSPKTTVRIAVILLVICLSISFGYVMLNRSTERAPTQEETERYAPYAIDWQTAVGAQGTDYEIILSLCTFAEEKTVGENQYKTYTSDTIGKYLYQYREILSIMVSDEGDEAQTVFIQYNDEDGRMVILGYHSEDGLIEKAIYDPETDCLYHDLRGTVQVWTNFRTGIQFGA